MRCAEAIRITIVKVFWTDSAVAQLHAIHDYLAQTSPDYAVRIVDRLTRRSSQIAAFPNSGRIVPEFGLKKIREVIEGRYRIIYLVDVTQLQVLAVIHDARDLS
jgi:plasmid stabilization system protein ParE